MDRCAIHIWSRWMDRWPFCRQSNWAHKIGCAPDKSFGTRDQWLNLHEWASSSRKQHSRIHFKRTAHSLIHHTMSIWTCKSCDVHQRNVCTQTHTHAGARRQSRSANVELWLSWKVKWTRCAWNGNRTQCIRYKEMPTASNCVCVLPIWLAISRRVYGAR